MKSLISLRSLATVGLVGVGASIVVTLIAVGRAGWQEEQTRPVRPTQDGVGSTTAPVSPPAAPWPSRRGAVPLQDPTGFRLLVADTPPFLLDLDRGSARQLAGVPVRGDTGVTVLPVGEHALVLTYSFCNGCPTASGVYLVRRGNTAATQLAPNSNVVPARDGEGVWMLSRRAARRCTIRELGLDGRPLRSARQVDCRSELIAELPAGLLVSYVGPGGSEAHNALVKPNGSVVRLAYENAQPVVGDLLLTGRDRSTPLLLHDVRSGSSQRLRWPSRRGYSLGDVTGAPNGGLAVVEFAKFSPEHKLDMWLLDTVTRRWKHLPGMPARIVPKATDVAWTADGRVVILAVDVLAVWRPSEPRLAVRLVRAAQQPGSEFVVW
jgi:hypothetical protein